MAREKLAGFWHPAAGIPFPRLGFSIIIIILILIVLVLEGNFY
jgi:hypothetical protein